MGSAAIRGVVRDSQGAPQMGALVELLGHNAVQIATAFTDDHGRYLLSGVLPGQYQVRATAAFLMPTVRPNLHIQPGTLAVVNLTMTTLFEAENWLPAQRRRADEPADDWKWTLRSTAGRPLLRLVDQDGNPISASSSERPISKPIEQGRVSVLSGDGAFGQGGTHQILLMNRTVENGDSAILRVDASDLPQGFPGPSAEISAGYEKRSPLGGSTRVVTSFQTHPELAYGNGTGLQIMRMTTTQQINLGDAVMIDAGTLMEAERLAESRFTAEPYIRTMVHLGDTTMVEYRYATGRTLQGSEDLDHLKPPTDVLTDANGRPLNQKGSHHEITVSRKLGKRTLSFSIYRDALANSAVQGTGSLDAASLIGLPLIADPTTGTFRMGFAGYTGKGLSGAFVQPLTESLSLVGEYDFGTVLWSDAVATPAVSLASTTISAHQAQAADIALRGKVLRTGTSLKAEYRWQPVRTLTQVNTYNVTPESGYLSLYLRQRLLCGRWLPQGIDAVVEATNLLEQGYQPVLAPDGHTLYLAQLPRAIQAGLAFNF